MKDTISKYEMCAGKYYHCDGDDLKFPILFKFRRMFGNEIYHSARINEYTDVYVSDGWFHLCYLKNLREATPDEIKWLDVCHAKGSFIEKNEIIYPYLPSNYKPKGEIEDFPLFVINEMIKNQVEQGNKNDVSVFENKKTAGSIAHGFDWDYTQEGFWFWNDVIRCKNFDILKGDAEELLTNKRVFPFKVTLEQVKDNIQVACKGYQEKIYNHLGKDIIINGYSFISEDFYKELRKNNLSQRQKEALDNIFGKDEKVFYNTGMKFIDDKSSNRYILCATKAFYCGLFDLENGILYNDKMVKIESKDYNKITEEEFKILTNNNINFKILDDYGK